MTTPTTTNTTAPKSNDPCPCGSGKKFKRCHKNAIDAARIRPGRVTPMRTVPPHIGRPPYADTGKVVRTPGTGVQTPEIIERMRVAGRIAAEAAIDTADGDLRRIAAEQRLGPGRRRAPETAPAEQLTLL